jgi:hypothetical protein
MMMALSELGADVQTLHQRSLSNAMRKQASFKRCLIFMSNARSTAQRMVTAKARGMARSAQKR